MADYLPPVVVEVIMRSAGVAEGAAKVKAEVAGMSDGVSASTGRMASDVDKNASKVEQRTSTMGKKVSGAMQSLGGSLGGVVGAPLVKVGEQMDQVGSKADGLVGKLASIGKVATIGGLAGFAASAYEGVKAAGDFQSAVAHIADNADETQKAAEGIGKAFLDSMGKSIFSAQEMAEAFASVAGQLKLTEGHALSAADATKVMAAAGDLAEGAHTSLAQSTAALSTVMQAYHLSVSQAAGASDTLFNVSRAMNVGIDQVASGVNKLHGRLGELAPSLKDTATMMVELGQHGITGTRGVSVANTALETLVGGSKNTTAVLKALGVNVFDSSGKFIGLQAVIAQLQPKLAGLTQQQQLFAEKTLFGSGAAQVMGQIIAGGVPAFQAAADAAGKAGTAQNAAAINAKTLHNQMELLKATVDDLGIKFGTVLIPVLEDVAKDTSAVIGWFEKHETVAIALGSVIGGVLATAMTVFAVQKLGSLISMSETGVVALSRLASFMTGGLVPALERTGTGVTDIGVKSSTSTPQVTGLGTSASTAAPEVEGLGTTAGASAGQVTLLNDAASTTAPKVWSLGGSSSTSTPQVAGLGAASSTAATEVTGLDAAVGTAAPEIVAMGTAAAGAAPEVGALDTALVGLMATLGPLIAVGGLGYLLASSGAGGPLPNGERPVGSAALTPTGQSGFNVGGRASGLGGGFGGYTTSTSGAQQSVTGSGVGGMSLSTLLGNAPTSTGPGGVWLGSGGQVTSTSFAASLLSQLGAPTNATNINALVGWMQREGNDPNVDKYNPLDTTEREPGSQTTNSAGVQSFTSWAQGLTATVATLKQGNFSAILSALKSGKGLSGAGIASELGAWSGGGYTSTPTANVGNAAIAALMDPAAAAKKGKTATYGPSQNVLNMLTEAQELVGAPYSKAGHASAYNETVAQIKKFGTDCSGLVSVLLKEGVSGIRAAQTTQGLPTAAGLAPGAGKYVTVWDRHTGPTDQEHTLIDILGKYFESGGNSKYNPSGGVAELTRAQAAGELAGGGFEAFHPTAAYLNTAVKGAKSSSFSAAAENAALQTSISAIVASLTTSATSLVTKLGNLMQSDGTPTSMEKTLGVSTGGKVPGQLHKIIGGANLSSIEAALNAGKSPTALDTSLIPTLEKASANSPQTKAMAELVAELRAAGKGGLANQVTSQWGAAMSTLAQSLTALQMTKNAESLKLQATQETDQTTLTADGAKDQLAVVTDSQDMIVQQMTAAATAIKDTTAVITDQFQALATSIQDATQSMSDASNATVQGIQDQSQTQVDTLGEKGLYGLGLIAQQETVQLDVMKSGFDGQIAAAQANVDATKAQWDATIAAAQLNADQVQLQQDQLVAIAQQNETMVQMQQDTLVASAQAHADSVALASDLKVTLAQQTVDLSASAPAAQQKLAQAMLTQAQAQQSKQEATANAALSAIQSTAAIQENAAENTYNLAQQTAATQEANAQQTLATAQGQGAIQEAYVAQALQTVQDTAAQQEAAAQATIDATNAQEAALERGGGTFNPYSSLILGANGSLDLTGGGGPLPYAGAYSAGGEGTSGGGSSGGTTTVNQEINLQSSADPAQLATEMLWLLKPYLAIS